MENVPQVIGKKNMRDFSEWMHFLESLGYRNYYKILNAKGFKIPQNRERCFMVSILGDYFFNFPRERKLKYRLKDFLDENVDESYYLSEETVASLNLHKAKHDALGNGFGWKPTYGGGYARTIKTDGGNRSTDNFIIEQGNSLRESNGCCKYPDGERLQGVRQPSNECGHRNLQRADGIMLETSEQFNAGTLKGISRAITTEGKNGVVEWKSSTK